MKSIDYGMLKYNVEAIRDSYVELSNCIYTVRNQRSETMTDEDILSIRKIKTISEQLQKKVNELKGTCDYMLESL